MKIGILTFHRALNPGAVLQCYALQETLKSLGYEVEVINYKQPFVEYKIFDVRVFRYTFSKPRVVLGAIRRLFYNYFKIKKVLNNYEKFRHKYLVLTKVIKSREDFPKEDLYVIGSDQLWGLHCTGGIDEIFFGRFARPISSRVIGYAISSNIESINIIGSEKLKEYTNNFDILSFREFSIRDLVYKLTGKESRIDIDPTLLADRKIWSNLIKKEWSKRKYIYACLNRITGEELNLIKTKIKIIANRLNCDVVYGGQSPEDFVSIINYAKLIISSSFHGIAFSLIFEKSFLALNLNDGHDERTINILNQLGASETIVTKDFNPYLEIPELDYNVINKNKELLKADSINYLKQL